MIENEGPKKNVDSVRGEHWPAVATEPFNGQIDPEEIEKALRIGEAEGEELRDRLMNRVWPDPNIQYR